MLPNFYFFVKIINFWHQAAENAAKLRGGREGKNSKNNSTEKTTKLLIVIVILFLVAEFPMVMPYLLLKSILRVAYFGILILCKRGLRALMNSTDLEWNFDWKIFNGGCLHQGMDFWEKGWKYLVAWSTHCCHQNMVHSAQPAEWGKFLALLSCYSIEIAWIGLLLTAFPRDKWSINHWV